MGKVNAGIARDDTKLLASGERGVVFESTLEGMVGGGSGMG